MRKLSFCLLNFLIFLTVAFFGIGPITAGAEGRCVYIGGNTAGFTLNLGGVQIVALCEVATGDGAKCPAQESGLKSGDILLAADGVKIDGQETLNRILAKSEGKKIVLTVRRESGEFTTAITPQKDTKGKYKIGVLIRDKVSGIGTVTYIDKESGRFGALGHPVLDERENIMTVDKGKVYECSIVSVSRGVRGKAGELKGLFVGEGDFGVSDTLNECGLFGTVNENFEYSGYVKAEVGGTDTAHPGEAFIYSTVNGLQCEKFSVSIVKVDKDNEENKNYVLKITDKNLIRRTGGIVQGMSGSPIVQDGKLVGAVTHVFLNDPTRGYGIGIERMLGN